MSRQQPLDSLSSWHRKPSIASSEDAVLQFATPQELPLERLIQAPEAVNVPVPSLSIQTVGCLFASETSLQRRDCSASKVTPRLLGATTKLSQEGPPSSEAPPNGLELTTRTKVCPPSDVVKLADRLLYLLQPPLEQIFANESLSFTHRPFPYQLDGIAFLYPRNEAVIADEMGLGKTMQAIVAMRLLAHQGLVRRVLIVCPKPLVSNWQREIAMWAPEMSVCVLEGKQQRREWLWKNACDGVLLTNYESLVRDHRVVSSTADPFDLMIIDESQRIKNRSSTTNQVICSVPRCRSWALTGTPIENSAEDLVGIFQFVSPGYLRPQMKITSIRRVVKDYVIRRTKDQVLTELPPKLYRDADLILSPEQQRSYALAEEQGVVRLSAMKQELTIQHVFELVLRLKQICNFDPETEVSSKADRLEADLEECASSGRKAIVFSQWVNTIRRLRNRLQRFGPLEYHGQISSRLRDGVIDTFRSDPHRHVLLMSYGAGSVGLNLQFVGYVFLFDRWWNPAVEDQAVNRAHRIGASGPVTVTRFLCSGTIEDRINRVLEEKRELFNSVFDHYAKTGKLGLSREDIFRLFQLNFPGESKSNEAA